MLIFVIRRVLVSIPVLIASTILTFLLVKISGDPLDYLKGRSPKVPQSQIDELRHRLWLDRSWPSQYWHWISNILFHWDFGPQVQSSVGNIRSLLFHALFVTLRVVIAAVIIALVLAIITGVLSAVRQYHVSDYVVTTLGLIFLSMPTVFFAAILKQAGIQVNELTGTQAFATIGDQSVEGNGGAADILKHLVLPMITLALVSYAAWSRFTRASMLETLNSDYVRLARSKGLSQRRVLTRHALRTALIPLTTVTALDIAALLGGAIVTETVFQWRGMGALFLTALQTTDFNVMLAWLLVAAVIVIAFNLLADLLYGVLDPRIRHA